MSQNRHFMELGQPHACVDFNPTSELALNPLRTSRIWALFPSEPSAACCCNYRRQKEGEGGHLLLTGSVTQLVSKKRCVIVCMYVHCTVIVYACPGGEIILHIINGLTKKIFFRVNDFNIKQLCF